MTQSLEFLRRSPVILFSGDNILTIVFLSVCAGRSGAPVMSDSVLPSPCVTCSVCRPPSPIHSSTDTSIRFLIFSHIYICSPTDTINRHFNGSLICFFHSWASASRLMPPASAFRHSVSQSDTGAFRYRTGSPYSGTRLDPASEIFVHSGIGLTGWWTVPHSVI